MSVTIEASPKLSTLNDDLAGTHPNVHNMTSGSHNLIGTDPGFVRGPSWGTDGLWGTLDDEQGDLRLRSSSAAINAGEDTLVVDPNGLDREAKQRIIYGAVDRGAYEFCIPGDADYSGVVDSADGAILGSHWGDQDVTWSEGDFDGNGRVGPFDASILGAQFGQVFSGSEASAAAPILAPGNTPPMIGPMPAETMRSSRSLIAVRTPSEASPSIGSDHSLTSLSRETQTVCNFQPLPWEHAATAHDMALSDTDLLGSDLAADLMAVEQASPRHQHRVWAEMMMARRWVGANRGL